MRILFLGGFGQAASLRDLIEGFELINTDYAYLPYMGSLENPAALKQALDEGEFDAVIGFCPFYSNEETLTVLAGSKPLKLMWEFDCPHREIGNPEALLKQLRPWDGSLTSSDGPYVEDFYRRAGKPYWGPIPPPALNISLNDPVLRGDASRYLVTLLGQRYDPAQFPRVVVPRHELAARLANEYGQNFGLWGSKWPDGNPPLPWVHCLYYWSLPSFTIGHHGEKDDHWYFNGRDTRAMGTGACYIQDRANEMDTFFEEGKECFFYDSTQDVVDIIEAHCNDLDLLYSVRKAGQAKVQEHFGQVATARKIVNIITETTGVENNWLPEGPLEFVVEPIDKETDGSEDLGGLWERGRIENHYEFEPLGPPSTTIPAVPRGAAGLRIYAHAGSNLIGHVALLTRSIGGYDVGGVCGAVMEPEWQARGATVQMIRVLKLVAHAAGYQAILAWTGGAQRFWAHAGLHLRPGGGAGCWTIDQNVTEEALFALSTPYHDSW